MYNSGRGGAGRKGEQYHEALKHGSFFDELGSVDVKKVEL